MPALERPRLRYRKAGWDEGPSSLHANQNVTSIVIFRQQDGRGKIAVGQGVGEGEQACTYRSIGRGRHGGGWTWCGALRRDTVAVGQGARVRYSVGRWLPDRASVKRGLANRPTKQGRCMRIAVHGFMPGDLLEEAGRVCPRKRKIERKEMAKDEQASRSERIVLYMQG